MEHEQERFTNPGSTSAPLDLVPEKDVAYVNMIYMLNQADPIRFARGENFCEIFKNQGARGNAINVELHGTRLFLNVADSLLAPIDEIICISTVLNKDCSLFSELKTKLPIKGHTAFYAGFHFGPCAMSKKPWGLVVGLHEIMDTVSKLPTISGFICTPLLCANSRYVQLVEVFDHSEYYRRKDATENARTRN